MVIQHKVSVFMIKKCQCRQGWIEILPPMIGMADSTPRGGRHLAVHAGLTG
jgi:hypothetical protein